MKAETPIDKHCGVAVTVFAYKRPQHLQSLFDSLARNPELKFLDLHVFIDGPRNQNENGIIKEVVRIAETFTGALNKTVYKSTKNKGLADSVINGVSKIFQDYSYQIVLEDDLILREDFLQFMLTVNDKFRNNPRISGANGYSYPSRFKNAEAFFVRGADCWGWSTWKDRWDKVNWDSENLYKRLKQENLIDQFNLLGNFNYSKILKDQIKQKIDSWAIRWHASMFLENNYTIFPNVSLVKNTGFDGSGTHGVTSIYNEEFSSIPLNPKLPNFDESNMTGSQVLNNYYSENKSSVIRRIIKKLTN